MDQGSIRPIPYQQIPELNYVPTCSILFQVPIQSVVQESRVERGSFLYPMVLSIQVFAAARIATVQTGQPRQMVNNFRSAPVNLTIPGAFIDKNGRAVYT